MGGNGGVVVVKEKGKELIVVLGSFFVLSLFFVRTVYYPSETDLALATLFVECGLAKEHSVLGAMVSQLFHLLFAVVGGCRR